MQCFAILITFSLLLFPIGKQPAAGVRTRPTSEAKQLFAVRGEIVAIKKQAGRMLAITIRPSKGFAETVLIAHENDLVGSSVKRSDDVDLLGLLGGESRGYETITAAELNDGDVVSVIFDPQLQNRSLEIYLH